MWQRSKDSSWRGGQQGLAKLEEVGIYFLSSWPWDLVACRDSETSSAVPVAGAGDMHLGTERDWDMCLPLLVTHFTSSRRGGRLQEMLQSLPEILLAPCLGAHRNPRERTGQRRPLGMSSANTKVQQDKRRCAALPDPPQPAPQASSIHRPLPSSRSRQPLGSA